MKLLLIAPAACAAALAAPSHAATVSLSGLISNSCLLTVPISGALVPDATGTVLRSDAGTGARSASLTVVALGGSPTLTMSVPSYTGPSGVTPDAVEYSYAVAGSGASRGFAATGATATTSLIDTVTYNGRVTSAAGFTAGTYSMAITVTCGQ